MKRQFSLLCTFLFCFGGTPGIVRAADSDATSSQIPKCAMPTPTPTPHALTIGWKFDAASGDSSVTAPGASADPAAAQPLASPAPAATPTPGQVPVAIPIAEPEKGAAVTLQAQLKATATGLELRYCADGAPTSKTTLRSGYEFAAGEPRILVYLRIAKYSDSSDAKTDRHDVAATPLRITSHAGSAGSSTALKSDGRILPSDTHDKPNVIVVMISAGAACLAYPSAVAELASKACSVVAGSGNKLDRGAKARPFDGTLTLPYGLLRAYFNLQNTLDSQGSPSDSKICGADSESSWTNLNHLHDLKSSTVFGFARYQTDDVTDPAQSTSIATIRNVDCSPLWAIPAYDAGTGNKKGTSITGDPNPSSGTDAFRRRPLRAAPLAAMAGSAGKTSDDKTQAPAGALAWTESPSIWSRITAQYDLLGLSFLTQNTTQLLGSLKKGFATAAPASDAANAKSSSTGDTKAFQSTDTGFFASNARLVDDADQYDAFHADLRPIDFAHIASIDYGVKSVFAPTGGLDGLGYFRSFETLASGTVIHAEQSAALWSGSRPTGYVDGALTYVVGNDPTAYKTTIALKDETHSVNLVPTLDAGFNGFEAFTRYGMSRGSQDVVGVFSYDERHLPDQGVPPIAFDAAVGYRTLGSTYTPLLTTVDPFIGEKTLFGTTGVHITDSKTKDIHDFDVDFSGARTLDPTFTAYTTVGAKLGYVPATQTNIKFTLTRSTIDADMLARQFNVPLPNDTASFYNNDAVSATLGYGSLKKAKSYSATDSFFDAYQQDDASYGELSAGLAWYRKASCTAKSSLVTCSDPYSRNVVGSAEGVVDRSFGAKLSIGLANDVGSKSGTKSLPANQLLAVAVLTARARCDAEFAASYTNNSSTDSRAFVAGNVFEARADLNVLRSQLGVLRVTYRRGYDASFVYKPGSSSGLFFTLAHDIDSQTLTKCTNGKPDK